MPSSLCQKIQKLNEKNGLTLISIALIFSFFSYFSPYLFISYIVIASIDIYLVVLLFGSAILSDTKPKWFVSFWYNAMPTRFVGLILFFLFFISLVFSWATIFLDLAVHFQPSIKTFDHAIYYSFLNMLTASYGDTIPKDHVGKLYSVYQLANAMLFIIGTFGLLLSRLSTFTKPTTI